MASRLLTRCLLGLLLALPGSVAAGEVLVAAAASLTDALTEIGRAYESKTGTQVIFDFGGTGTLARQIETGAPVDVFFSADVEHMEQLARAGRVAPGTRLDLLSNVLVAVVPPGASTAVAKPADLLTLRRIALADPESVPAGTYARSYLRAVGLWETMRDRVVPTQDVRAALAAVEGGHVEAAIVYRTDAAASRRVRVAFEVPHADGPRIVYTVAALTGARPGAADLVHHLGSREARAVFERHGFVVLGGT